MAPESIKTGAAGFAVGVRRERYDDERRSESRRYGVLSTVCDDLVADLYGGYNYDIFEFDSISTLDFDSTGVRRRSTAYQRSLSAQ